VVCFTPRPLCPQGRIPWYPFNRRLCGPQSRSGRDGKEKNSQPVPGTEPPIIQHYSTELSRFLSIIEYKDIMFHDKKEPVKLVVYWCYFEVTYCGHQLRCMYACMYIYLKCEVFTMMIQVKAYSVVTLFRRTMWQQHQSALSYRLKWSEDECSMALRNDGTSHISSWRPNPEDHT
jgi:hypothetical protein